MDASWTNARKLAANLLLRLAPRRQCLILLKNRPLADAVHIFRRMRRDGPSECAPDHCGLMPANLITLVHLSIFSAMNLANSSGEFGGTTTAPRSANRCLRLGSSTAALVCWLSVAMISGGVPIGTPKPIQPAAS